METQKFMVTSKRNDYLHAYHTEYEVGDDNDREIAMKAIDDAPHPHISRTFGNISCNVTR